MDIFLHRNVNCLNVVYGVKPAIMKTACWYSTLLHVLASPSVFQTFVLEQGHLGHLGCSIHYV
jgi:hypothetical protein